MIGKLHTTEKSSVIFVKLSALKNPYMSTLSSSE